MPTIKDVARRAKVSPGTVSNALSGKRKVSAHTYQRITKAIEEMGYEPNMIARSLVSRRSHTFAVVASGLQYYGPSRNIVEIERKADELGFSLLLSLVHEPETIDADTVLRALAARGVDGIIWAVHEIGQNRAWVTEEKLARLPPVVFISMQPRPGLSLVTINNRAGAWQAVEHLLTRGRTTIGLITGPVSWWEARERQRGWKEALKAAGREPREPLIAEGDWSAESGRRALKQLIQQNPQMDAVFASNDQMALGVLSMAHELGIHIPEDLAIVGFDNVPEAAHYLPPLTTIDQSTLSVGCLAVQELHRLAEARFQKSEVPAPRARTLTPKLVVRESS